MLPHEQGRPLPAADGLTAPFWAAAVRHEFRLQHCDACARFIHPPKPRCPRCRTAELSWRRVRGSGAVYTFAVVEHVTPELHFEHAVPYASGLVELDEQAGLLFQTRIVGCPVDAVHVGMRVEARFHDVTPDVTLIHVVPVEATDVGRAAS